jgi:two-component system NtrC family sensor kinase
MNDGSASVDSAPVSQTDLLSVRAGDPQAIPAEWLDRLLSVTEELPILRGEDAVAQAFLEGLSRLLTQYALGARLAVDRRPNAPKIHRFVATAGRRAADVGDQADSPRMFAALKYERVVPIPGSTGSTLHVASDLDDLDAEESSVVHLLRRAAIVLGQLLPKARTVTALSALDRGTNALSQRMLQVDKLATFGQLAAGVVHELNNPLTSIVACAEYLIRKADRGTPWDSTDNERLKRINESANRMLYFTRELVGYARPTTGVKGPVKIHDVIDQAAAFCEHVLASNGIAFERKYASHVPLLNGISEQLVQIFVNLLTNACQAVRPDAEPCVTVTTSMSATADDNFVVIGVSDNGIGIAPENLPYVFVPFFTTKQANHGIGLGLSISKNIVDGHGGAIRVESAFGQGTQFVIELPVR